MVTHDVHESLAVVDYVYFMSSGRMVGDLIDELEKTPAAKP